MRAVDAHTCIAQDVRSAKSSFYWPMLFQTREKREALFAIYAFARVLDDIADGHQTGNEKRQALEDWRLWLTSCFTDGAAPPNNNTPLKVGLYDVMERHTLPLEPFLALICGMEADVNRPIIAPTWAELEVYCGQVAGAVGLLCLAIWGWTGDEANAFDTATGEALQLTNILRDISDDARIGRLYIPDEALQQANVIQREPDTILSDPNFAQAYAIVSDRAALRFDQARNLWPTGTSKALKPAWVMLRTYEALFRKVQKTGFTLHTPRTRLSSIEKVFHLTAAYLTTP